MSREHDGIFIDIRCVISSNDGIHIDLGYDSKYELAIVEVGK